MARGQKLTTEEFVKKARVVHGDKYDYSLAKYVKTSAKVVIICPEHGEFSQTPNRHLAGCGCPKCGRSRIVQSKTLSHEEHVIAILGVNPDINVLERITNVNTPVLCLCKICTHKWSVRPRDLKCGKSCPKCAKLKQAQRQKLPHDRQVAAIAEANPYVEVLEEITSNSTKVLCRCRICSYKWTAIPNNLKRGEGCPKCAKLKRVQRQILTHKEQVEAILKVNPSIEILEEIVSDKTKALCRCNVCGHRWKSTPNRLKCGNGCPKCSKRGFLSHDCGSLYIMVDDLEVPTMMKIGVSINPKKRKNEVLKSAQKAGAGISDLHIVKTWSGPTENMQALEKAMHGAFGEYKINFGGRFDGSNEFFYYRPEVFAMVEKFLDKTVDNHRSFCYS